MSAAATPSELAPPVWDKRPLGRAALIDVALGHAPADRVIAGGTLLNVHTGRLGRADVAIRGARIAAVGDVSHAVGEHTDVIDAAGTVVVPGLVAPHFHQWHSNHNGTVVAQALLERGTTAVTDGFYAAGIVAGPRGIRVLAEEILRTPLKLMLLVPTHSYAQNRAFGYPPAPRSVTARDMLDMLEWPECWGVEETGHDLLLDPRRRDPAMLAVLERAHELRKVPTGHGINFPGPRQINGWIAAGIMNNHEAIDVPGACMEADLGLHVLFRHCPGFENARDTVGAVTEHDYDTHAFQICPDIAWADSIFEGNFDEAVREAIRCGVDPVRAIQMSTLQPARFFRADHEIGSVAAGRFADVVLLSDLERFTVGTVLADGEVFVERGERVRDLPQPDYPGWTRETMRVPRTFAPEDFTVEAPCTEGTVEVRVIDIVDGEYFSRESTAELRVVDGRVAPDPARGINLVTLIERLRGDGEHAVGFVRGFGLRAGAMGSASNPMTQAIVVVGATAADLAASANRIVERGGAFVAARDGRISAEFRTPILGMTSDLPYAEAKAAVSALVEEWRDLGCTLSVPFAYLEFVAATTEPRIRISTKGLVRVSTDGDLAMEAVPLIVA